MPRRFQLNNTICFTKHAELTIENGQLIIILQPTPQIVPPTFTLSLQPITNQVPPLKGRINSLLKEGHFDPRSKWGGHPTPKQPKPVSCNQNPYLATKTRILQPKPVSCNQNPYLATKTRILQPTPETCNQ